MSLSVFKRTTLTGLWRLTVLTTMALKAYDSDLRLVSTGQDVLGRQCDVAPNARASLVSTGMVALEGCRSRTQMCA